MTATKATEQGYVECSNCDNEADYRTEHGPLCSECVKKYALTPDSIEEIK